jgi:hypothetical protein
MSTGTITYECNCSGTITEEWGINYDEVSCDKCDNPIDKDCVEYHENGDMIIRVVFLEGSDDPEDVPF